MLSHILNHTTHPPSLESVSPRFLLFPLLLLSHPTAPFDAPSLLFPSLLFCGCLFPGWWWMILVVLVVMGWARPPSCYATDRDSETWPSVRVQDRRWRLRSAMPESWRTKPPSSLFVPVPNVQPVHLLG